MSKLHFLSVIGLMFLTLEHTSLAQDKFTLASQQLDRSFQTKETKPTIYLLGVFHFAGEQVDSSTTQFKWRYQSLTRKRQQEIEVVRQKLLKINPTVICIELQPKWQSELDSVYAAYCRGKLLPVSGYEANNEIIQLAFEIGKRLGVKRIKAVDAKPMAVLNEDKLYEEYKRYAPKEDRLFNHWDSIYYRNSSIEDSLLHHWSTLDFLRLINRESHERKTLGRWLIMTRHGENTNPVGADQFISKYFNRNARIYSNIQRSIQSNQDRVLVIYGNTHMTMLRPLFLSSPLYEVVSTEEFLK